MKKNLLLSFGLLAAFPLAAAPACIDLEEALGAKADTIRRVPARFGYGWDFGSDSGLLPLDREYSLNAAGGWSVESWIRPDDPERESVILSSNRWNHFRWSLLPGGLLKLEFSGRAGRVSFAAPFRFRPGIWHHVAAVQQPDGTVIQYVDGEAIGRRRFPGNLPGKACHIGTVGSFRVDGREAFDHVFAGVIDRPRLYRHALNDDEVCEAWRQGVRLLPLTPAPQQVSFPGDARPFPRPNRLAAAPSSALKPGSHARARLEKAVKAAGASIRYSGGKAAAGECVLELVTPEQADRLPPELRKLVTTPAFPREGYCLRLRPDKITLAAATGRGFYYGILTLAELWKQQTLPAADLFDYPEFDFRAALVVVDSKPPMELSQFYRDLLTELSEARANYIMLRTHDWALPNDPACRAAMKQLADFAASRYMTVLPYLQTYSHAKGFLYRDPRFGHTVTVKDETLTLAGATALARKPVVTEPHTPVIVRDSTGAVLAEGRDYRLVPGGFLTRWEFPESEKIAHPWTRPYLDPAAEPWRISPLPGGAVRDGDTVQVTYDVYSGGECTCPRSAGYREALRQSIKFALETTGSDCINLGMDEIWQIRGEGRCCPAGASLLETMVHEFNQAAAAVRAVRPGVKVMCFSDMFDPLETPPWKATEPITGFEKKLDHSIVMMPWYYGQELEDRGRIQTSVQYFSWFGFRTLGISGKLPFNQLLWADACLANRNTSGKNGFCYTMWDAANTDKPHNIGLGAFTRYTWSPGRLHLPALLELSMRFAALNGGTPLPAEQAALRELAERGRRELRALGPDLETAYPTWPEIRELLEALRRAEALTPRNR